MEIIKGDLIKLAKEGRFDVIAHGCNCVGVMGAGIAKQMADVFRANSFPKEKIRNINKLGTIDYQPVGCYKYNSSENYNGEIKLVEYSRICILVNAYTQYLPGANLDYEALQLCLRKINHNFKDKHIGLPKIGCGIAGGKWSKVSKYIQAELTDCKITIVQYEK